MPQSSDRVRELVREVFGLEPDYVLEDSSGPGVVPGWDSLGTFKLVEAAEQRFSISFHLEDFAELTSIGLLCRIVEKHLEK
jgi:acyl carrier protein